MEGCMNKQCFVWMLAGLFFCSTLLPVVRGNLIGHPTDSTRGIVFDMDIASTFNGIQTTNADSVVNNTVANVSMYCEAHFLRNTTFNANRTRTGFSTTNWNSSIPARQKSY